MVIKEFTAGKSAQIVIPGVGEQWIKLNPVVTVEEGETFEEACDAAFKKIDEQLKKHIPEQPAQLQGSPKGDMFFKNATTGKLER